MELISGYDSWLSQQWEDWDNPKTQSGVEFLEEEAEEKQEAKWR